MSRSSAPEDRKILAWQVGIVLAVLIAWEGAVRLQVADKFFFGLPSEVVEKPASADLVLGQTDERDLGIAYARADRILWALVSGHEPDEIVAQGFSAKEVDLVRARLESTHWKRRLPTVAIVSATSIGESYLRPVDYGTHPDNG